MTTITLHDAIADRKLTQAQINRLLGRINNHGRMLADPIAYADDFIHGGADEEKIAEWFSAAMRTAGLIGLVIHKDQHEASWYIVKSDTPWLFFDSADEFHLAELNATYDSYIKSRRGKKQDALEAELERKKAILRDEGVEIELVQSGRDWEYVLMYRILSHPLLKYLDPFVW